MTEGPRLHTAENSAIRAAKVLLGCVLLRAPILHSQQTRLDYFARGQVSGILHDAHEEVEQHYYDPTFHGLDWNARYKEFSKAIGQAHDQGQAFGIISAFLNGLGDSHTFFIPPNRVNRYEMGYRLSLVGDACFVTQVRPKTDAESKLHIGDQVLTIGGFRVDRQNFRSLVYDIDVLAPQRSLELDLQSPSGEQRRVVVNAMVQPDQPILGLGTGAAGADGDLIKRREDAGHVMRQRMTEQGDVAFWKLPEFFLSPKDVESSIGEARRHRTLILDLRGDRGGSEDTLKQIVGSLFDRDIRIADRVGRKTMKPLLAKHLPDPFEGKLIVLVDAGSASASELLARVVQLEHRGTVIGDKTAGAVMESRLYQDSQGAGFLVVYGFSVTEANLVMSDGKSLENAGVVPDEPLLPTAADLAAGRDVVLARAAELAGVKLDPVEAGKMFPVEWVPF
jgi:carboxyl-terminal processing protease